MLFLLQFNEKGVLISIIINYSNRYILVPAIISNPIFAQSSSYFESLQDETRATTLYFSIKPLDNWAYQNVDYTPANFLDLLQIMQ